jgi:plastocyanin
MRLSISRFPVLQVALLAAIAACAGSNPVMMRQDTIATIDIYDFYYSPATVTVSSGTTVQWVNRGPSAHTSTSDDGFWDSGNISPPPPGGGGGGTPPPPPPPPPPYAHGMALVAGSDGFKFNTPGTYGFHCTLHPPSTNPGFVGTVTVTE